MEEEVTVVLRTGKVGEIRLCYHVARADHLEGDRFWDVMFYRGDSIESVKLSKLLREDQ